MNDEDDFQRMLDANPDDHNTRLVFADWLQERDDPRAEGYRWLGESGLRPIDDRVSVAADWSPLEMSGKHWGWRYEKYRPFPIACLPALLTNSTREWSYCYGTRREAEDAAALAFSRLSAARRAELLGLPAAGAA